MNRISQPWKDWLPGVLGKGQIVDLANEGYIQGFHPSSVDHSSFDLHLTGEVYELAHGAIKPDGRPYIHVIRPYASPHPATPESSDTFLLHARKTYVVKLRERLVGLHDSRVYGQATAKSTVGRVDVLARLVVDGMAGYEAFNPNHLGRGTGDLFLEITSMTFSVEIKSGCSLSQLRLFYGPPEVSEIRGPELIKTVLREDDECEDDYSRTECFLSVDLRPARVSGHEVSAFSVADQVNDSTAIKLWNSDPRPNPCNFWKFLKATQDWRLLLEHTKFYILRSKEKLALPKGVAAYCRATDETIGEMRIHYAGFVHPFFGRDRQDERIGTPLIFEVRGHDVPVSLADGEVMARLIFYRMSIDAQQESRANESSGVDPSPYGSQELKLSKFFADWPAQLVVGNDGSVTERN